MILLVFETVNLCFGVFKQSWWLASFHVTCQNMRRQLQGAVCHSSYKLWTNARWIRGYHAVGMQLPTVTCGRCIDCLLLHGVRNRCTINARMA